MNAFEFQICDLISNVYKLTLLVSFDVKAEQRL